MLNIFEFELLIVALKDTKLLGCPSFSEDNCRVGVDLIYLVLFGNLAFNKV